jgi:aminopeptidase N
MDHRTAFGGGHAYYHPPRYHEYRLDNVKIIASFDERAGAVFGDVTNTITTIHPSTTYVDFDSADLHYSFVGDPDGQELRYQTFGETLRVFLPKPAVVGTTIAVETRYTTHPTKGVYFVRPDSYYPDRPWEVWSQGEMVDNHFWFPTYDWPDEKATSETIVSVPEGQTVVSNGRLAHVIHNTSKKTVTYDWIESVPHSTYLISIVAGTFAQWTDRLGKLPVTYYAPPADRAKVAYDFRATPDMIAFFQQFNDYPFPYEKYAQSAVVDFTYGGMENMSATTQTSTTLHDRRAELDGDSEGLVAHELAHQWWGDLETMQDWGQVWLNEGYATYYEALYRGHAHGEDAFDMDRQGMMDDVFNEDVRVRHPIVTEVYGDPIDLFDADGYSKAGLVLHMLRTVLGTDEYRKSQTAFLREYATKSANTQEWEASVERTTGQDLHWFVDEWLYKAGFPEYTVSYAYDEAAHVIHLTVDQTQSTAWNTAAVFTMPIAIETQTADGKSATTTVNDDSRTKTFDIPSASAPAMVLFDPGHNILSKVTFKKSDPELEYQMRHASSVLDRLEAAQKLIAIRKPSAAQIAGASWFLEHERFDDARAAIVDSLDNLAPDTRAHDALRRALDDPSAHVRSAAAAALSDFKSDPQTVADLARLAASDPSYATTAASVTTLAQYDAPDISAILARALTEPSNNRVIASAALHGYAIVEKNGAIALEERYATYGAPQASRNAAIGALGSIGKGDEHVTAFLTSLLGDPNFRTNFALFRALGQRADPKAIPALERFAKTTEDVRLRQGAQAAVATIEAMTRRPTKRP